MVILIFCRGQCRLARDLKNKIPGPKVRLVLRPFGFVVPNWCEPFSMKDIREDHAVSGWGHSAY